MTSPFFQRLLMASVTALLVVGVAGAAVHDEGNDPVTAEREEPMGEPSGAGAGASSSAPSTPTTAVPQIGGSAQGTPPTSGGPEAAATSGASAGAGTFSSGSGLGASGNGEIATGGMPLADTGSYPLAVPGTLLLGLGGACLILGRTARRAG